MICPTCGGDTRVLSTRDDTRIRVCKTNDDHRFETVERVVFIGRRPPGRPIGGNKLKNSIKRWSNLR